MSSETDTEIQWAEWSPGRWHAGNLLRDFHAGADPFFASITLTDGRYQWSAEILTPNATQNRGGFTDTLSAARHKVLCFFSDTGVIQTARGRLNWRVYGPNSWVASVGSATVAITRNKLDDRFTWSVQCSGNEGELTNAVFTCERALELMADDIRKKIQGE